MNKSLIQAGVLEIKEAGLADKRPRLLVDDQFRLGKFGEHFDFMVAISLFTHLPMNVIIRCLSEVREYLKPSGVFYSTFFQAPKPAYLNKLPHQPGGIVTKYDCDPFHYAVEELSWMATSAGLEVKVIGDWNHPRDQKMAAYSIPK